MSQYIAVSKKDHKNYGYKFDKYFSFASEWNFIPISSAELLKFIAIYPVLFQKQQSSYQLGIPTGVGANNCLINPHDGKFLIEYVPAILRRYPFNLLKNDNNEDILCVLADENGFKQLDEGFILEDTGELSEKGRGLVKFLGELNKNFLQDANTVKIIAELDLLVVVPFQLVDEKTNEVTILRDDLYKIDEARLLELGENDLTRLMKGGCLALIYGHLFSLNKLNLVVKICEAHKKLLDKKQEDNEQITNIFADDDSDILKF